MSGYRYFMRSVRLNFLFIFFLTFGLLYQGYADDGCPSLVKSNTNAEANLSKAGKGFWKIISFDWGNINFDEKLLQYIKVKAIEDQGIDGYFNPKIRVCDYEGDNCHELYSRTSCQKIYGTQGSGAGVSAAVFIDWEGDKTKAGGEIAQGLEWEWAEGVTDEEKVKFANSPKICACSQKSACLSGASATFARLGQGANIFRPGEMAKVCDTCSWGQGKQKIKCAPVPLAPGPPPFCEQLAMSPPQVRIVPITNGDNDYFNPKVKVIAGDLIEEGGKIGKELDFPRKYKKDKAEERSTSDEVGEHSILDKDGTTHYFATYREKDKLCAEYHGTQGINEQNPQFVRCFPAPPAPEPEVVKVVNGNTLEIRMKMSKSTCTEAHGTYSDGLCTFNVITNPTKNIGPLSLKVVKPRIVKKTTNSDNNESNIDNVIESIFKNSPRFTILEQYGYVPNIGIELPNGDSCSLTGPKEENKCKSIKLELDNMGQPKIEVRYMQVRNQVNSNSKMLCLSGWQPEPEEFVLKRGDEIIPLKLMRTKYIKYNAVYSKESNQFYYLPSKEIVDPLKRPQDWLDKIIFNKQGYVFFPDDNKQEKGKCSYCVDYDKDIDEKFINNKVKVVYKLIDVEHREKCNQGDDGCICFTGTCSRSTRYVDKKNTQPFYTKISQNTNGVVTQPEAPIKATRTEVFYADKLCRFDLEGLKEKLKEIIEKQLKNKEPDLEKNNEKSYDHESEDVYTDDLSIMFDRIEIEAWGSGEAGHIKDTAHSTESRVGMPGDYIKAKLKIDPDYPMIKVQVTEGGGNQTDELSQKDGGPIFIEMCRSDKQDCKPLITVAGGGKYRTYGGKNYKETVIHKQDLKLKEEFVKADKLKSTQDNQIAYIENGGIKYETVICESNFRSNKHGAGGCIDKNSPRHMQKGIYGKGSPGYVKIRPIIKEFDEEEINAAIKKVIEDQYDLETMTDFSTQDLNVNIREIIEEEVKKELLR